jgi:hypothetical protein
VLASVLREIISTSVKLFLALPGLIAGMAALREIGEKTGFDKRNPNAFAKFSNWINTLLYILVEHWLACILLSVLGGTMWALLVVEPRNSARREFDGVRRDRLGE